MMVTFEAQIQGIRVFVERTPEATAMFGDSNGRVELAPKMGKLDSNKVGMDSNKVGISVDDIWRAGSACTNRRTNGKLDQ